MTYVVVSIGQGRIGQPIARRVGVGKDVLLAALRVENASAATQVMRVAKRGDERLVAQARYRSH